MTFALIVAFYLIVNWMLGDSIRPVRIANTIRKINNVSVITDRLLTLIERVFPGMSDQCSFCRCLFICW